MKVWVTFFILQKCVLLKMKYAVCCGSSYEGQSKGGGSRNSFNIVRQAQ